jgi:hypothetical protein
VQGLSVCEFGGCRVRPGFSSRIQAWMLMFWPLPGESTAWSGAGC